MPVTHPFVSGKADDPDTTLVNPSDWNDEHTVVLEDADIPASIARDAEVTSSIATHAALPDVHHAEAHTTHASIELGASGPTITTGAGDPEGSVTAPVGSVYLRTTGLMYLKKTGAGNTGWAVMVSAD